MKSKIENKFKVYKKQFEMKIKQQTTKGLKHKLKQNERTTYIF